MARIGSSEEDRARFYPVEEKRGIGASRYPPPGNRLTEAMTSTSHDIENLLAEADWLERLARQLTRNRDRAEELVQETWLAALSRPPRSGDPRAWLTGVLRNLHRFGLRSEERRRRREASRAVPEATSPKERARERASLQHRLAEEILQLDDSTRAMVVLHYFDGLPMKDVAARLDTTPEAVRQRLHRAREKLRKRLEKDHGDGWRSACLAALPALRYGAENTVIMSTTTKLAAAVVLIVGAALLATRGCERGDLVPEGLDPEVAVVELDDPAVASTPATTEAPQTTERDAVIQRAALFGWEGQVLGSLDEPIPGAVVLGRRGMFDVAETITDEEGCFLLPWPHGEEDGYWWTMAIFEGLACQGGARIAPSTPPAEVTLRLSPGMPVPFRVVDADSGLPLAGMLIGVQSPGFPWLARDRSDELGHLTLHCPTEGSWQATALDPFVLLPKGWTTFLVREGVPVPEIELAIRLFPERFALTAVDRETGAVLTEATFRPSGFGEHRVERLKPYVDVDGGEMHAELPRAELPAPILVEAPGYAARQVVVVVEAAQAAPVPLDRIGAAVVRILRAGEPREGVRVSWSGNAPIFMVPEDAELDGSAETIGGEVITDGGGLATLPISVEPGFELAGDRLHLSGTDTDGLTRDWGQPAVSELGEAPWTFDLEPATARVIVSLRDEVGNAVAGQAIGLSVTATEDSPLEYRAMRAPFADFPEESGARVVTDVDGRAEAVLLAPGKLNWHIVLTGDFADPWGKEDTQLQPGEERYLDLIMPPEQPFTISGVVRTLGGEPPDIDHPFFRVRAIPLEKYDPESKSWLGNVTRDEIRYSKVAEDGTFQIERLSEGRYMLQAVTGGVLGERTADAGDRGVELILGSKGSLYVRVFDDVTGQPLEGAQVFVGKAARTRGQDTGVDGGAAMTDLAWEADQLLVLAEGYASQQLDLSEMTESERGRIELRMKPTRLVRIVLLGERTALDRVAHARRADWSWRRYLPFGKDTFDSSAATITLEDAPTTAFTLQLYDAEWQELGASIEVPESDEAEIEVERQVSF